VKARQFGPTALALIAALAGLAGCSGKKPAERVHGRTLTIYASVPLTGDSRVDGQSVIDGARLALDAISSRIGRYQIALHVLNDATVQRGEWDPGQTFANARAASANPTTIGYIGELNSGASAVSIPVLNRVGIGQISPTSTAVGLTTNGVGASPGEPQKYYPSGRRTFARIVPNDAVQAGAQVQLQIAEGCTKTYVLDDSEVDGLDMATSFEDAVHGTSLKVAGLGPFPPGATDYSGIANAIAATGANCVLISALTDPSSVLITRQIAARMPRATLFGGAGMADSGFTNPIDGGIPVALDPRVLLTVATLGPHAYPPVGRAFIAAYAQRFGDPQPDAIYGYEAMSLMLHAITVATGGGRTEAIRSKVVAAIFDTRDRHSVLGTYSIDRNGDTTLRRYGAYRVLDGELSFWKALNG
jgi:branched-chain amino acid transport system substrate-binding protein